jgi:hypothetical protein
LGDFEEEGSVAADEIALGGDDEGASAHLGEGFEEAAGAAEAAFGGLVGVGGGAEGDGVVAGETADFGSGGFGGEVLGEDAGFEVVGVVELHEFVGIAGVAVAAGEFAAAVGVDGPIEGHALGGTAIEEVFGGEGAVFDAFFGGVEGALAGESGDTGEHFGYVRSFFAACQCRK